MLPNYQFYNCFHWTNFFQSSLFFTLQSEGYEMLKDPKKTLVSKFLEIERKNPYFYTLFRNQNALPYKLGYFIAEYLFRNYLYVGNIYAFLSSLRIKVEQFTKETLYIFVDGIISLLLGQPFTFFQKQTDDLLLSCNKNTQLDNESHTLDFIKTRTLTYGDNEYLIYEFNVIAKYLLSISQNKIYGSPNFEPLCFKSDDALYSFCFVNFSTASETHIRPGYILRKEVQHTPPRIYFMGIDYNNDNENVIYLYNVKEKLDVLLSKKTNKDTRIHNLDSLYFTRKEVADLLPTLYKNKFHQNVISKCDIARGLEHLSHMFFAYNRLGVFNRLNDDAILNHIYDEQISVADMLEMNKVIKAINDEDYVRIEFIQTVMEENKFKKNIIYVFILRSLIYSCHFCFIDYLAKYIKNGDAKFDFLNRTEKNILTKSKRKTEKQNTPEKKQKRKIEFQSLLMEELPEKIDYPIKTKPVLDETLQVPSVVNFTPEEMIHAQPLNEYMNWILALCDLPEEKFDFYTIKTNRETYKKLEQCMPPKNNMSTCVIC
jgi:hypothetical protein